MLDATIAETAALIGNPARANMLMALMGGRFLNATELRLAARVAPSTASGHLAKLVDGRLVIVLPSGRHRYYRLASERVAGTLEQLMALSVEGPPRHRPASRADEAMIKARSCYDHLAGRLGVSLAESLAAKGHVTLDDGNGAITDDGMIFFERLGLRLREPRSSRRPLCRTCMDWTERRWHLGGRLGSALLTSFFEQAWVARQPSGRALHVTPAGRLGFFEKFGISA